MPVFKYSGTITADSFVYQTAFKIALRLVLWYFLSIFILTYIIYLCGRSMGQATN